MNNTLLIIDPQNDFVHPLGSLCVKGADGDMERLANLIILNPDNFNEIIVTLDSHTQHQIFHPSFWKDSTGNNVKPFTQITLNDFDEDKYVLTGANGGIVRSYLERLQDGGKFPLIVWPEHCIIGTWGHNIYVKIAEALAYWETATKNQVKYVFKGMDQYREMYSALKPEIMYANDPLFNAKLGQDFLKAVTNGNVIVAGEALSHCVANTVRDLVDVYLTNDNVTELCKNINILEDATSNVTGFEQMGEDFVNEMKKLSVKFTACSSVFTKEIDILK